MSKRKPFRDVIAKWSSGRIVDELGLVKAEISPLKKREDDLKNEFRERGESPIEGKLYRGVLCGGGGQWRLDMEALKKDFGEQVIQSYMRWVPSEPQVRVYGRSSADGNQPAEKKAKAS